MQEQHEILVKAATDNITPLDAKPSDSIENVMGNIQNEEGTPHVVVEMGYIRLERM